LYEKTETMKKPEKPILWFFAKNRPKPNRKWK